MKTKPKIIVLVGPTASGKSDLAVKLAHLFNGEVVSADSRQVYRGMNIGTGKITKAEMRGVPHHLLDVTDPKRTYSVNRYQREANKVIKDILKQGKLPIIVGGSGFYIDTLVTGQVLPNVKPNLKLRRQLEKFSTAELLQRLKDLDPHRVKYIDPKNPRRLIRAIEIAKALGRVPPSRKKTLYDVLWLGVTWPEKKLKERIRSRLKKRLQAGLVAEVRRLKREGLSWKRLDNLGLEYRYVSRFLQGQLNRKQLEEELSQAIWQYARRQMTWLKRNKEINWL